MAGAELLVAERAAPGCPFQQGPFCANFQANTGNVVTLLLPSDESSGEKLLCLVGRVRIATGRGLTVHLSHLRLGFNPWRTVSVLLCPSFLTSFLYVKFWGWIVGADYQKGQRTL